MDLINTWLIKGFLICVIIMLVLMMMFLMERHPNRQRFFELAIVWVAAVALGCMGVLGIIN